MQIIDFLANLFWGIVASVDADEMVNWTDSMKIGETGRGIIIDEQGVVEIKDASQNIKESTGDTTKTIEAVALGAQNQSAQTEEGVMCAEYIGDATQLMFEISDQSNKSTKVINEVLDDLSAVAQENAASTQEILAISEEQGSIAIMAAKQGEELAEKVQTLQQEIDKFKL